MSGVYHLAFAPRRQGPAGVAASPIPPPSDRGGADGRNRLVGDGVAFSISIGPLLRSGQFLL